MKLSNFVKVYTNKKNNQIKLELRKSKLKDVNMDVKDILSLDIKLNKKIEKFDRI
jgi:hypothetical protein